MSWTALLAAAASAAKPAAPSTATTDPFFGSTLASMDSSGWTVNFGDGATQTATTGDRGGNGLTSTPQKAIGNYPIPQNAGGIGTPGGMPSLGGGGSAIPWGMVAMFGGAAALILLWKR